MAPVASEIDTARYGTCLDMQMDHFNKCLAVAYEDSIIRIFDSENGTLLATVRGHHAPVCSLSWAHPTFGNMLASGAEDQFCFIWRERAPGDWFAAHQQETQGAISVVAFAPCEYGLLLALASVDGKVTMISRREVKASAVLPAGEAWNAKSFAAHESAVLGLSWGPSTSPVTLAAGPAAKAATLAPKRLVTGGEDGMVRIWRHENDWDTWTQVKQLDKIHGACVLDVAWRPNLGIPCSMIASCAEDGSVVVWVQDMEGQPWRARAQWQVEADARRLAWSNAGSILSVSAGDSHTFLYREGLDGEWEQVTTFDDKGDAGVAVNGH